MKIRLAQEHEGDFSYNEPQLAWFYHFPFFFISFVNNGTPQLTTDIRARRKISLEVGLFPPCNNTFIYARNNSFNSR